MVYLANRFLYRVVEFLRHWYVNAFVIISHKTTNFLEALDRNFALKITARHWLRPLYQDYTFVGYVLGISFRTIRIILAVIVYLGVVIGAAVIYVFWAIIPAYIIYKGFFKI